jgi:hypothetical protein
MSELVELVRAWYTYLGGLLSAEVYRLLSRLGTDGAFRAGFAYACGLALLVGLISGRLLFWYGRVRAFYRPVPVVAHGQKPSDIQRGCTMAALKIAVILLVIGCLLLSMLSSSANP